jgi:hypothetical protein
MADQASADRQAEIIHEEVNLARARLDALTANLPARHIPLPPLPPINPLQPQMGMRFMMAAASDRMRQFTPLVHRMPPPAAAAATWTDQQQQQRPLPMGSAPPQLCPQNGPPPDIWQPEISFFNRPLNGHRGEIGSPTLRRAPKETAEVSLNHLHNHPRPTRRGKLSPRRWDQGFSRPPRQGITPRNLPITP